MVRSLFQTLLNCSKSGRNKQKNPQKQNERADEQKKPLFGIASSESEIESNGTLGPRLDSDVRMVNERVGSANITYSSDGIKTQRRSRIGSAPCGRQRSSSENLLNSTYMYNSGLYFGTELSQRSATGDFVSPEDIMNLYRAGLLLHQTLEKWVEKWQESQFRLLHRSNSTPDVRRDRGAGTSNLVQMGRGGMPKRRSAQGRALSAHAQLSARFQKRHDHLIRKVLEAVGPNRSEQKIHHIESHENDTRNDVKTASELNEMKWLETCPLLDSLPSPKRLYEDEVSSTVTSSESGCTESYSVQREISSACSIAQVDSYAELTNSADCTSIPPIAPIVQSAYVKVAGALNYARQYPNALARRVLLSSSMKCRKYSRTTHTNGYRKNIHSADSLFVTTQRYPISLTPRHQPAGSELHSHGSLDVFDVNEKTLGPSKQETKWSEMKVKHSQDLSAPAAENQSMPSFPKSERYTVKQKGFEVEKFFSPQTATNPLKETKSGKLQYQEELSTKEGLPQDNSSIVPPELNEKTAIKCNPARLRTGQCTLKTSYSNSSYVRPAATTNIIRSHDSDELINNLRASRPQGDEMLVAVSNLAEGVEGTVVPLMDYRSHIIDSHLSSSDTHRTTTSSNFDLIRPDERFEPTNSPAHPMLPLASLSKYIGCLRRCAHNPKYKRRLKFVDDKSTLCPGLPSGGLSHSSSPPLKVLHNRPELHHRGEGSFPIPPVCLPDGGPCQISFSFDGKGPVTISNAVSTDLTENHSQSQQLLEYCNQTDRYTAWPKTNRERRNSNNNASVEVLPGERYTEQVTLPLKPTAFLRGGEHCQFLECPRRKVRFFGIPKFCSRGRIPESSLRKRSKRWAQTNNVDYKPAFNGEALPLMTIEELKSYTLSPSSSSHYCDGKAKPEDNTSDTYVLSASSEFLHSTSDEHFAFKNRPRPGIAPGRHRVHVPEVLPDKLEETIDDAPSVQRDTPSPRETTPDIEEVKLNEVESEPNEMELDLKEMELDPTEIQPELQEVELLEQKVTDSLETGDIRISHSSILSPISKVSEDAISTGSLCSDIPSGKHTLKLTTPTVRRQHKKRMKWPAHKIHLSRHRTPPRLAKRHTSGKNVHEHRRGRFKGHSRDSFGVYRSRKRVNVAPKPPWNISTRNYATRYYAVRPIESFLWPSGRIPSSSGDEKDDVGKGQQKSQLKNVLHRHFKHSDKNIRSESDHYVSVSSPRRGKRRGGFADSHSSTGKSSSNDREALPHWSWMRRKRSNSYVRKTKSAPFMDSYQSKNSKVRRRTRATGHRKLGRDKSSSFVVSSSAENKDKSRKFIFGTSKRSGLVTKSHPPLFPRSGSTKEKSRRVEGNSHYLHVTTRHNLGRPLRWANIRPEFIRRRSKLTKSESGGPSGDLVVSTEGGKDSSANQTDKNNRVSLNSSFRKLVKRVRRNRAQNGKNGVVSLNTNQNGIPNVVGPDPLEFYCYISVVPSEIDELVLPFRACNKMRNCLRRIYKFINDLEEHISGHSPEEPEDYESDVVSSREESESTDQVAPPVDAATAESSNVFQLDRKPSFFQILRRKFGRKRQQLVGSPVNTSLDKLENDSQENMNAQLNQSAPSVATSQATHFGAFENLTDEKIAFWQNLLRRCGDDRLSDMLLALEQITDRRIFAIEQTVMCRIKLDETVLYAVRGLPCLEMCIRARTVEQLQIALARLEDSFPKLYEQIVFTERFYERCGVGSPKRFPTTKGFLVPAGRGSMISQPSVCTSRRIVRVIEETRKKFQRFSLHHKRWNTKHKRAEVTS
ncbi:unnamed protein product [Calicophoron daubneyi]|uniref:Uncharacterized protein n=1 Tax=Calicophoron daubneyi TaxID=300641 RepID=A0AAV2TGB2_CALDB